MNTFELVGNLVSLCEFNVLDLRIPGIRLMEKKRALVYVRMIAVDFMR